MEGGENKAREPGAQVSPGPTSGCSPAPPACACPRPADGEQSLGGPGPYGGCPQSVRMSGLGFPGASGPLPFAATALSARTLRKGGGGPLSKPLTFTFSLCFLPTHSSEGQQEGGRAVGTCSRAGAHGPECAAATRPPHRAHEWLGLRPPRLPLSSAPSPGKEVQFEFSGPP